jgi:uncharacterized membrane protein (UPF0127 family)/CheY-like chemotaxis protein
MGRRRGTLTLRREDGRIVCEHVKLADTYLSRTVGLLGRRTLPSGQGVVLRPSFSIHTFFMRFPIDVIFLDVDLVVMKIAESVPGFRTASCRGAREVVELAAGECARRGLTVGDRVAWAAHSALPADTTHDPGAGVLRETDPRGRVLVASRDARFVKLTRFLLDGKGIETAGVVQADRLSEELDRDDEIDVVLLDAQDAVAPTLTVANTARALRPEVQIIVVAESQVAERAPAGVRVYDKWNETDDVVAAVEEALGDDGVDPEALPLDGSA